MEKKYTIKELLASEEAMKDLLHERLLAVRDDLTFVINAKQDGVAAGVAKLELEFRRVNSRVQRLEALIEGLILALDRNAKRSRWKTLKQWLIKRFRRFTCFRIYHRLKESLRACMPRGSRLRRPKA